MRTASEGAGPGSCILGIPLVPEIGEQIPGLPELAGELPRGDEESEGNEELLSREHAPLDLEGPESAPGIGNGRRGRRRPLLEERHRLRHPIKLRTDAPRVQYGAERQHGFPTDRARRPSRHPLERAFELQHGPGRDRSRLSAEDGNRKTGADREANARLTHTPAPGLPGSPGQLLPHESVRFPPVVPAADPGHQSPHHSPHLRRTLGQYLPDHDPHLPFVQRRGEKLREDRGFALLLRREILTSPDPHLLGRVTTLLDAPRDHVANRVVVGRTPQLDLSVSDVGEESGEDHRPDLVAFLPGLIESVPNRTVSGRSHAASTRGEESPDFAAPKSYPARTEGSTRPALTADAHPGGQVKALPPRR